MGRPSTGKRRSSEEEVGHAQPAHQGQHQDDHGANAGRESMAGEQTEGTPEQSQSQPSTPGKRAGGRGPSARRVTAPAVQRGKVRAAVEIELHRGERITGEAFFHGCPGAVLHCGRLPAGSADVGLGPSEPLDWEVAGGVEDLQGGAVKVTLYWDEEAQEVEVRDLQPRSGERGCLIGRGEQPDGPVQALLEMERSDGEEGPWRILTVGLLWPDEAAHLVEMYS